MQFNKIEYEECLFFAVVECMSRTKCTALFIINQYLFYIRIFSKDLRKLRFSLCSIYLRLIQY